MEDLILFVLLKRHIIGKVLFAFLIVLFVIRLIVLIIRQSSLSKTVSDLSIKKDLLENKLGDAGEENERLRAAISEKDNSIRELEEQIDNKESNISELNQGLVSIRASLSDRDSTIESLMGQLEDKSIVLRSRDGEIEAIKQEKESLQRSLSETNNAIGSIRTQLAGKEAEIRRLTKVIDEKDSILNSKESDINDLTQDKESLQGSLSDAKKKIESLESLLSQMESGSDSSENNVENKKEELEDQIDSLNARILSLSKELDDTKFELNKQISLKDKKESTIAYLNKQINKLKKPVDNNLIVSKTVDLPTGEAEKEEIPIDVTPTPETIQTSHILDSNETLVDLTKRTIDTVIDVEDNKEISASSFFKLPESTVFKKRCELEKAIYLRHPKYVCKYCGQMVRISGRKTERGQASFFSHLRDSEDCDYKTTTGKSKKEIERIKYASEKNEGNRHRVVKESLARILKSTKGVSDVHTEHCIKGEHPILRWRRPDVSVRYRGQDIVFELQLSTTFASVITERDLFYRLNKIFIIWVFNFDDDQQYVNLENMMVKDVYYNNRLNIFIFDKDAEKESLLRGELVLKCNWLKPDKTWANPFYNTFENEKPLFVTLEELTYPDSYKPFFYDAETPFYHANPAFFAETKKIDEENTQIIADLDELWEKEKQAQKEGEKKATERLQSIVDEYGIEEIVKTTKRYLIGKREGRLGLLTLDGVLQLPFIYDKIETHRGWYVGITDESRDYCDNDFIVINGDVRGCEKAGIGDLYVYVKEVDGDYLKGLMSPTGEPITPATYTELSLWSSEMLLVKRDGFYGLVDSEGVERLWGYSSIDPLTDSESISVEKNGRSFCVDHYGHSVETKRIEIDENCFKVLKAGLWGIVDDKNNILVPYEYDEIGTLNNHYVGIKGSSVFMLEGQTTAKIPVEVEFIMKNERDKLVFKVGKAFAFMNHKQQQKARSLSVNPREEKQLFISRADEEFNLLYLSASPVFPKAQIESTLDKDCDEDIPLGFRITGFVTNIFHFGVLIKEPSSCLSFFISRNCLSRHPEDYYRGQKLEVEKTGFDEEELRHFWKVVSE